MIPSLFSRFDTITTLALKCDLKSASISDGCDVLGQGFSLYKFFWLSKETDGCDFGWEKNRMDVVKLGGITWIDDMTWEKKKKPSGTEILWTVW